MIVAIDPGKHSAVCVLADTGLVEVFRVRQMDAAADSRVQGVIAMARERHARVVIERSPCRLRRFTVHRAYAREWNDLFRREVPRVVSREYVDPRVWQKALGIETFGKPGDKERSVRYCEKVLGERYGTSDEADARCIAEWAKVTGLEVA